MPSISAEMSRAVGRRSVPLNSMCSEKWAMPADAGCSQREPEATEMTTATLAASRIGALRMRAPLGRVSSSNMPLTVADCLEHG